MCLELRSLFLSFLSSLIFYFLFLSCLLLSLIFLYLPSSISLLYLLICTLFSLKKLTFLTMLCFHMSFNVVSTSLIFTIITLGYFMYIWHIIIKIMQGAQQKKILFNNSYHIHIRIRTQRSSLTYVSLSL